MLWNNTGTETRLRPNPVSVCLERSPSEFSGAHRMASLPRLGIMLLIKKPCVGLTGSCGLVLETAEGGTSLKPILVSFLKGFSL